MLNHFFRENMFEKFSIHVLFFKLQVQTQAAYTAIILLYISHQLWEKNICWIEYSWADEHYYNLENIDNWVMNERETEWHGIKIDKRLEQVYKKEIIAFRDSK